MPKTAVGNFEERGDTDWFRVHVEEGKTYTITTWDTSILLALAGPDGTPINPPVAYTNQITFVATETGDYWVSATNTGEPRFYSFELNEVDAPNPATIDTDLTITVGETVNSTSNNEADDWYAVELEAGQSYLFSSELGSNLYLSDANGNLITLESTQLHFTPAESGTYYAGVNHHSTYSLKLEEVSDDHGTDAASAGTMTLGAATDGAWETGADGDWYAISLTAGSSYSFSLDKGLDGVSSRPLAIYDSSGQLVALDGSGFDETTMMFSPDTSGIYYVAATRGFDYYGAHTSQGYSLTAELVPGDLASNILTAGTLSIGATANGAWEGAADSDWYEISLAAGQNYSFDLNSDGWGLGLSLYDAAGNELFKSSNGPFDTFAQLGYTAVASGTYYIGVSTQQPGSGAYSLTSATYTDDFADNSLTVGVLTVNGAAIQGTIQAPGDRDWFAVELQAGHSYFFPLADAALVLRDAQGNALTSYSWFDSHFTPSTSGTYYLEASGSVGAYYVSIAEIADDYRQDISSTGVMRNQLIGTAANELFVSTSDHEAFAGLGGDDRFVAGDGMDQYSGGAGVDTVSFTNFTGGVNVRLWQGGLYENSALRIQISSMENVEGTAFADVIEGNSAANLLSGGAGNDALKGLSGNDTLLGSAGNDMLDGGADSDTASYADAAAGVNVNLALAGAQDSLGAGIDTLVAIESLIGSAFADTLRGDAQGNSLSGGDGDDRLIGNAGNDSLTGGLGYDRMYGGLGDDTYYASDADDYAYENAGEGTDQVHASVNHQLRANVENLTLSGTGNLVGEGNELGNVITGNSGANKLYGYDGNDTLNGQAGDDYLLGGTGNDTLTGGAGYDRMYGGSGDDRYVVVDVTDYVYENAAEGTDRVVASINHQLRANVEELELAEGGGDLRGYGNAGNNLILGNSGTNLLYGRDGFDTLRGNGGNDILYGENGNDVLDGGAGQDRFYGGAQEDNFVFEDGDFAGMTSATADRIHDFVQFQDIINLGGVDANSSLAGDQSFAFIGPGAFTGVAGQLRYQQISGNTYVQGDVDGDGTADFWIRVDGLHNLMGSDFII